MRSLDQVRAWKRPEPTKWAVVVIFLARVANRENKIFSRNNFGQNRTKRARASAVVISRSTPSCYGIVADTEHSNNAQKPPSPPIHMWGRAHPHGEFRAHKDLPHTCTTRMSHPCVYVHAKLRCGGIGGGDSGGSGVGCFRCWSWWRSWLSPCVYRARRRQWVCAGGAGLCN